MSNGMCRDRQFKKTECWAPTPGVGSVERHRPFSHEGYYPNMVTLKKLDNVGVSRGSINFGTCNSTPLSWEHGQPFRNRTLMADCAELGCSRLNSIISALNRQTHG